MRLLLPLLFLALSNPVAAHPGHLADLAGHDHWVAGAAIGAAILIGLWGAVKGKAKTAKDEGASAEEETA